VFKPHFDDPIETPLQILFETQDLIAIDKPSGFHVHPLENPQHRTSKDFVILYKLRDQLQTKVYPIHRLDVGTSGVLLFAKNPEAASRVSKLWTSNPPIKKYLALVRGDFPEALTCHIPLLSDSSDQMLEALTEFKCLHRIELKNTHIGKRYPHSRYSLVEAFPQTGRYHQIRRHLNRLSYPLIGDRYHGDSHHNRYFREVLGIPGLCLRAISLDVSLAENQRTTISVRSHPDRWLKIQSLFSV
jgi:tRNA pseudouridine65 synthase